jgi:hypothetical protein
MWKFRKSPKARNVPFAGNVWVTAPVIEHTVSVLRSSGSPDELHEGVVYWAGRRFGSDTVVTTCIAPAARTTEGSFETSAQTNARAILYLGKVGLELIAQVHSHPGKFVDHSRGDDQRALMPYEGFLSVVVPLYGRYGVLPLTTCGVHVFERGRFRRLENSEVEESFRVIPEFSDLRRI